MGMRLPLKLHLMDSAKHLCGFPIWEGLALQYLNHIKSGCKKEKNRKY